jgi:hypothetical protein
MAHTRADLRSPGPPPRPRATRPEANCRRSRVRAAGGGGELYSWLNRSSCLISPSARPPMTSAFSKRYLAPQRTS